MNIMEGGRERGYEIKRIYLNASYHMVVPFNRRFHKRFSIMEYLFRGR